MASQEFTSYYLQRTTQEFAEDLDKVRAADDFKADSLPFLVHALQQGTALYPAADQARVVRPAAAAAAAASGVAEDEDEDVDMEEPQSEKKPKSGKKEKSKRRKSST